MAVRERPMQAVFESRSPVHDESAVDIDALAGHITCAIAGQKNDHIRDIVHGLPATQWHRAIDLLPGPCFVVQSIFGRLLVMPRLPDASVEWRLDHAWIDHVDPNALGRQILGQALREIDVSGFTGAIGRIGLRTYLTSNAPDETHAAR